MSEKKPERVSELLDDDGQGSLKKVIIFFTVVEALILIPLVIYIAYR